MNEIGIYQTESGTVEARNEGKTVLHTRKRGRLE